MASCGLRFNMFGSLLRRIQWSMTWLTSVAKLCQLSPTPTPNPALNADAHRRAFSPPAVAG